MKRKALVVGVGMMGTLHSKKINDPRLAGIELAAACDCDIEKLVLYSQQFPDVPIYLVPRNGVQESSAITRAEELGIPVLKSVKDVVERCEIDTLVNATHNDSHIPVLREALSVKGKDGKTIISMVFQEKPFALDLEEAHSISDIFKNNDIILNLNGILTFSPIWEAFLSQVNDLTADGYNLTHISCT